MYCSYAYDTIERIDIRAHTERISVRDYINTYVKTTTNTTITHHTNVIGELGTFCETTGEIYDGYENVSNTNCICKVKQSNSLNSKIVGIICSEDKFASHGDVLVKVVPDTYELGDILCPDENGYGRKASEVDVMFMMLHSIPRPKITSINTGRDGYVACFMG